MSVCTQYGTISCMYDSVAGDYYGFRIENGQCYQMEWLCNGRSFNPGNCSCANVVTNDRTAKLPTAEMCIGKTGAFATCNAVGGGATGLRFRWENGKCLADNYVCPSGSLTPTPTTTVSTCPWDLDGSRTVDQADLGLFNAGNCYNPLGSAAGVCLTKDFNHNGVVNALDYSILLTHWGSCPAQ